MAFFFLLFFCGGFHFHFSFLFFLLLLLFTLRCVCVTILPWLVLNLNNQLKYSVSWISENTGISPLSDAWLICIYFFNSHINCRGVQYLLHKNKDTETQKYQFSKCHQAESNMAEVEAQGLVPRPRLWYYITLLWNIPERILRLSWDNEKLQLRKAKKNPSWWWQHTPLVPALGRQRKVELHEFEGKPGLQRVQGQPELYGETLCQKRKRFLF